jgi:hypothetical protein
MTVYQTYEGPCPLDPEYKPDLESTGSFRMPMFDDLMTKSTGVLAPEFTRDMYARVNRDKMRATVDRTIVRMKDQFTCRIPMRFDPVADTMAALQTAFDQREKRYNLKPVAEPYLEKPMGTIHRGEVIREPEHATQLFDQPGDETDELIKIWDEEQERINARANRKHFKRIRTFCHLVGVAFNVALREGRKA